MPVVKNTTLLFRETIREWQEDGAASIAAALAYYAIFSLSPLLIIIALIIGAALDRNTVREDIPNAIEETIGADAAQTVRDMLDNNEQDRSASPIGAIIWFSVVIWGASGLFAQLQQALNKIWEVRAAPGRSPVHFVTNRVISFAIVLVAAFLLLTTLVINTGLAAVLEDADVVGSSQAILRIGQIVVNMAMLTIMFAMIFKILPDVIIRWTDVWVGSAFTALLFFVGQFAVSLYLSNTDAGSVFGAAGSLTILLVWIYYSAQILLFGAEFTEVWARRHGAAIRPDRDAVWINEAQARREAEAAGLDFDSLS